MCQNILFIECVNVLGLLWTTICVPEEPEVLKILPGGPLHSDGKGERSKACGDLVG